MTAATLSPRAYLDYNATAPLRPEARSAALAALEMAANPSSVHTEGRRARALVEDARAHVAALVGAQGDRVIFTSGASEAANLALAPDLIHGGRRGFDRLVLAATEHAAVLHGHRFPAEAVSVVPVLSSGVIDLTALARALAGGGRAVVAVQAANNETGVMQPLDAVAHITHSHGAILVSDVVQAAGRVACDAMPADMVFLSGHKLGGLAGAGALVLRSDDLALGTPMLRGGGQERGLRAGTENVAAMAAFGAAAACGYADSGRIGTMRDRFEAALLRLAPDAVLFGRDAERLSNTSAFAVPGITAERLLMALDLAGIAVSSGSACASGKVGRSHVLEAMGVAPDLRMGAIRVSFGWNSSDSDVERVADVLGTSVDHMRRRRLQAAA